MALAVSFWAVFLTGAGGLWSGFAVPGTAELQLGIHFVERAELELGSPRGGSCSDLVEVGSVFDCHHNC